MLCIYNKETLKVTDTMKETMFESAQHYSHKQVNFGHTGLTCWYLLSCGSPPECTTCQTRLLRTVHSWHQQGQNIPPLPHWKIYLNSWMLIKLLFFF